MSDWQPGSSWKHQRLDPAGTIDVVGTVIESSPAHRLAYTWARPNEVDDEATASRVSFDIEPKGDRFVRLTVTHENFEHDPGMLADIADGWPMVLSNLKTLLETGHPLQDAIAGVPKAAP
jgi:uncharacterized protein YndB with AHSA1/START domain